jgi:hypothetical protein
LNPREGGGGLGFEGKCHLDSIACIVKYYFPLSVDTELEPSNFNCPINCPLKGFGGNLW